MNDNIALQWRLMRFETDFLRSNGTTFQELFSRIMQFRFPSDFIQVRPWGSLGDQKCDGWLSSELRLFQVYAPNELSQSETERKMDADFAGALIHWKDKLKVWTFVHNSKDGIPPFVLQKLAGFNISNQDVKSDCWGYSELRRIVSELNEHDLTELFGHAPSQAAMQSLRYSDIETVLSHVMATDPKPLSDFPPVPQNKLSYNSFSDDVVEFIKLGFRKSRLVATFFENYREPRYGDAMAYQFSQKYQVLKDAKLTPDQIFWELRAFAGAQDAKSDKEQAAALAILAHFFEECDIFERPCQEVDS